MPDLPDSFQWTVGRVYFCNLLVLGQVINDDNKCYHFNASSFLKYHSERVLVKLNQNANDASFSVNKEFPKIELLIGVTKHL